MTIVVALTIVGTFFLCYRNFEYLAQKTSPQVLGTLYLKDGLNEAEIAQLRERLLSFPKVQTVEFKAKASVLNELQQFLGGTQTEISTAQELFPDVLELQLTQDSTSSDIDALSKMMGQIPQVAEVDFSEDWITQYLKVKSFLKGIGVVLMSLVLVGCTFITANFMGIRHQSRQHEIDVIRLIGGSRRFVLGPFLWEAFIEGLLGAFTALAALYLLKVVGGTVLTFQWSFMLNIRDWLYLSPVQLCLVVASGVLVACVGSITVFLRFEEKSFR